MSCHQRGDSEEGDTRFPDWHRILTPDAQEGEVIVTFSPAQLPNMSLLLEARKLVFATYQPAHVTAHIRERDAFRTYDNDSEARRRGTYSTVCASHFNRPGEATAIMPRISLLHVEAQAQLMARLAQRRAAIPEEEVMDLT